MIFFKWPIYFRCTSHLFVELGVSGEPRAPGEVGLEQTQETDPNFSVEPAKGRSDPIRVTTKKPGYFIFRCSAVQIQSYWV